MKITDEMLQEAAAKVSMAVLDTLPEAEDCEHNFSPQFHRNMRKLLYANKKQNVLRHAVAAILIVLVGTVSWLGVDVEARAAFLSWIRTQYENIFVYHFSGPGINTALPTYTLCWLPEGYVEANRVQEDTIILCTYTGPDDGILFFSYSPMNDGIIDAVTTNGIEPESVVVNGMAGDFYLSVAASETNELIWFDQDANLAFSLSSFFDKTVMMHIAENVFLESSTN